MGQAVRREDALEIFKNDFNLPVYFSSHENHTKDINKLNIHSFLSIIDDKWLQHLEAYWKPPKDTNIDKLLKDEFTLEEIFKSSVKINHPIKKVNIHILKKDITIPFNNDNTFLSNLDGSYFNLMDIFMRKEKKKISNYVAKFQHEKEHDYQPYHDEYKQWDEIRPILEEIYNLNIIQLNQTPADTTQMHSTNTSINLLPILAVIETDKAVYIIEEYCQYTLSNALKYSPAILQKNHIAFMFLFYQLLHCFTEMTRLGFIIKEELTVDHIKLLHNSLWLGLSPFECLKFDVKKESFIEREKILKIYIGFDTNLHNELVLSESLEVYTTAWCEGNLSNFDYLIIINILAGRKFGDPLNHPVFPWVTDFTSKYNGFRDLTKTKFRLNKGDRQLDATFSAGIGGLGFGAPIQHHVSDVLSDITYYIYHARDTSKNVLCTHVRSRWVPDEYPSSMERMYSWTPDECIPEFFYDINIFKSIHSDLVDIGFPEWLSTPEEFVKYHYDMLESNSVSLYLHCWIDLVFGYKLIGSVAKKEKNVHLSLVDGHKDLKSYGIVQLFSAPHPKKKCFPEENGFLECTSDYVDGRCREFSQSFEWEYIDITSSIKKSKNEMNLAAISDQEDFHARKRTRSFTNTINNTSNPSEEDIVVPYIYEVTLDIHDVTFLQNLEETEAALLHELSIKQCDKNGIGKYEFGSIFENKPKTDTVYNIDYHSKLLVCLLTEIVVHKELRTRTNLLPLDERLKENLKFLQSIPSISKRSFLCILFMHNDTSSEMKLKQLVKRITCTSGIKYFIEDLLDIPDISMDVDSETSSSIQNYTKWPLYFEKIHFFLSHLYSIIGLYDTANEEFVTNDDTLNLLTGIEKSVDSLQNLLQDLNSDGIDLLLLYLIPLFEMPQLQVPMYLHFFLHISHALGPIHSKKVFIKGLQKIFDGMKNSDEAVLLQQSFLSKALSSFGPETFLLNLFPLILDVLTNDNIQSPSLQRYRSQSSSLSTSPSLVGGDFKSESLLSYEVSPFYGEEDSIKSFNLDCIFGNKEMEVLSDEYTHSITDDEVAKLQLSTTPTEDQDEIHAALQSPSTVIIDDLYVKQSNNLPVLSSQELHSSSTVMIDINSESFDDFNSAGSSTTHQSIDKQPSYATPILLSSTDKLTTHRFESLEEAEEVLEEIPDTISFEKTKNEKVIHINAYESVVESIKWLIPWLGPVLTTQYVARPLMKKLLKVFLEIDNSGDNGLAVDNLIVKTVPIIECLMEVALVYGDKIVLDLFLKQVSQVIENAITTPCVSILLGSNLVTSVQLMVQACKILHPDSILSNIEEFSVDFFQPLIRLLSTVKPFTTGSVVKEFLSRKLIDILGLFCQKLKREIAQDLMAPLLQQFFSCFDGIYTLRVDEDGTLSVSRKYSLLVQSFDAKTKGDKKLKNVLSHSLPAGKFANLYETDASSSNTKRDRSEMISIDEVLQDSTEERNNLHDQQFADIYNTFSASLAYHAYVLFCRVMGTLYVEKTLYNSDLVWHLFTKHDEKLTIQRYRDENDTKSSIDNEDGGNKTVFQWMQPSQISMDEEIKTQRSSWQHIDGKWYEHWKNCKDLDDIQNLEFEDLKLQTYAGHSSAIRDFYVSDNEHYFLSASRDKTVKLWLLKNHGNGTAHLGCSRTYDNHTKAIFAVQGIESKKLVASCDGEVHIWDPVSGTTVSEVRANRGHTVTCIRTLSAPSTCVAVATTEGNVRLYDVRQKSFAQEWKLSPQISTGMVRSMCSNIEGSWLATGLSNGITAVLDLYAGVLRSQTRVHDYEIVQMAPVPYGFVSASVDYNIRMWHEDGTVSHLLKTSNENIHTLEYDKQQLVWATSNNKMYIHPKGKFSLMHPYRIAQEAFKGNLSKMTVLSTNSLFLFGTDNGNVILYA